MFYIDGNEINVTKGDTAIFQLKLDNYTFVNGDVVHFNVKRSPKDEEYSISKEVREFEGNIVKIILTSKDTRIDKGKYWYDIQCNLLDGRVDTVINKERFIVLEDINNEW